MRSVVAGCAWAAKKGHVSNDAKIRLLLIPSVIEAERRRRHATFVTLFPDSGPLGCEPYQKHIEFFEAGATYKERLFMAANRVGKTIAGAYEATCHLTGRYPHWWRGRRFEKPTDGWACGTNSQTTRDVWPRVCCSAEPPVKG